MFELIQNGEVQMINKIVILLSAILFLSSCSTWDSNEVINDPSVGSKQSSDLIFGQSIRNPKHVQSVKIKKNNSAVKSSN